MAGKTVSSGITRPFHGMLVIDKEAGYTSNDVVARLRGILHMKKIGHTGTLDPDAVGVLPVCLGNGTKLVDLIADRDKEYVAVCRLGVLTDTQDMSGTVLEKVSDEIVAERLEEDPAETIRKAAEKFLGEYAQIPPMYSALKVGGRKLYELAREGKIIERQPRIVRILELEILSVQLPVFTMRVRCSKGTYIRTLCEDMGKALGVGGAMEFLRRTRVGGFTLPEAKKLDEIQKLMEESPERIREILLPVDSFFEEAVSYTVQKQEYKLLCNGNSIQADSFKKDCPEAEDGCRIRMYDEQGRFYALYRYERKMEKLLPEKMFYNGQE